MNQTSDTNIINHIMAGEVRFKENDQTNEEAEIQYSWDVKFGENCSFLFDEK